MAKLPGAFKAADHGEMNDYSAIPSGDYPAKIVKSEWKDNSATAKDPKGKKLVFHMEIISGKFKGRKMFTNLNLVNKNAQAVEIAQNELATICRACGKVGIKEDTAEIHNIPFKMKVALVPDSRGKDYPDKNEIKGYSKLEDAPKPEIPDAEDEQEEQEDEPAPKRKKMPWETDEDDDD